MHLKEKRIGLAVSGSHCTIGKMVPQLEKMVAGGAQLFPIISPAVALTDTRFGEAWEVMNMLEEISGRQLVKTIVEAEPVGPQKLLDILVIVPCTGNTLAKLANGITDNAVLMAAKAHLRNQGPVVLAIATNDGLGLNARNIGTLLITKNIFLVPFGQDDPYHKPNSLVSNMELLIPTVEKAFQGKQIQPVLVTY